MLTAPRYSAVVVLASFVFALVDAALLLRGRLAPAHATAVGCVGFVVSVLRGFYALGQEWDAALLGGVYVWYLSEAVREIRCRGRLLLDPEAVQYEKLADRYHTYTPPSNAASHTCPRA